MEELIALISVINKNKTKQIEIIGSSNEGNSYTQQLYDRISSGELTNDIDAANFFFSGNKNKATYYNRLKRKLKDRLINTLFFIDINQPSFKENQKAYYTCYKNLAAVKIMIGRNARQPAIDLAEKTLKKSIRFEFTDITLALAKELRIHYSNHLGNRHKFTFYNKMAYKYSSLLLAELKAEEYYSDIVVNFANSRGSNLAIKESARKYASELGEIIKNHESYRLYLYAYTVIVLQYEIVNDYKSILEVCDEALSYFQQQKHLATKSSNFTFLYKKLAAHIHLSNYDEAEKVAKSCLDYCLPGSRNWYVTLDYRIILFFRKKLFQEAYDVYLDAIKHPNFKQQYRSISEHWRIYEAFIHYFIAKEKITPREEEESKQFRVSKFLNEVPIFTKDKQGNNINILILQILFLIQQGKYGEIIDRMEPLKTYAHRYLRKDETYRSNCFIKMLLQLPQNSFHKAAVIRKAKKYEEKLTNTPINVAKQNAELEIVPYEMLWEFVLESLDDKFH